MISHVGGKNTKQLDRSGFKGEFVMQIPLATFALTSLRPESGELSPR